MNFGGREALLGEKISGNARTKLPKDTFPIKLIWNVWNSKYTRVLAFELLVGAIPVAALIIGYVLVVIAGVIWVLLVSSYGIQTTLVIVLVSVFCLPLGYIAVTYRSDNYPLAAKAHLLKLVSFHRPGFSVHSWDMIAATMNDYLHEIGFSRHLGSRFYYYDGESCQEHFRKMFFLQQSSTATSIPELKPLIDEAVSAYIESVEEYRKSAQ
ncbi:LAFE_0B07822g1_1 [Lachancea fermentati]|uniref:LAFE_0B07822g1_1 n=1 Tax=Lachancea fermentati TaxID=4955 RepID=A0A1G4M858_LACFM|nr:LAFE_0B07822g1_1 [Lachancea fermentati]